MNTLISEAIKQSWEATFAARMYKREFSVYIAASKKPH